MKHLKSFSELNEGIIPDLFNKIEIESFGSFSFCKYTEIL